MHLPISVDPKREKDLITQICEEIILLINHGKLNIGDTIPPSRELSQQLGVSRNTVIAAYEKLALDGYVRGDRRHGTKICARQDCRLERARAKGPSSEPGRVPALASAAQIACRSHFSLFDPIRSRLQYDFRVGLPDASLFPHESWSRCIRDRLGRATKGFVTYPDPSGHSELRHQIVDLVRLTRGINCSPDQVIVTAGIQEGLNVAARLLLESGDAIAVEDPTYSSAAAIFKAHGAQLLPLPVTEDVDESPSHSELKAIPKAIYVTPSHQFPMGSTMSLKKRLELLAWAKASAAFILEDDYDSDFRYRGSPLLALASLDDSERVIYFGTFSKTMGAGIRLAYMVVPPTLATAARAVKGLLNHGRSWLEQAAMAEFIAGGHFDKHVRHVRQIYGKRCTLLAAGLNEIAPDAAIRGEDGGMHLSWILPPDMNFATTIQRNLIAEDVGIYTLPDGPAYFAGTGDLAERVILLGYACLNEPSIQTGLERIKSCVENLRSIKTR